MPILKIYRDNYIDSTVISNYFIDEYMKDANDAQLKVYLYLIRMLNANISFCVSDIADKFNHTEREVIRALKYWEKKGVLSLEFDSDKTLVGIHLIDLKNKNEAGMDNTVKTDGAALVNSALVPSSNKINASVEMDSSNREATASNQEATTSNQEAAPYNQEIEISSKAPESNNKTISTQASSPSFKVSSIQTDLVARSDDAGPSFVKPVYTADQLRAFRNNENDSQLLFIVEAYVGRPLTVAEVKTIIFFTDVLNFSEDLIDYLVQYCVDKDKKDFKYIEKVAINWAQAGISTPDQAKEYSTKYDKNVYAIMNELGKSSTPTPKELEYITRWTKEYGFTNDIIFEACERTVMATDRHRFEYAESILNSWHQKNVHHKTDIKAVDSLYQKSKTTVQTSPNKNNSNKFNQFTQNNYDFDALEKELLSN